MNPKSIRLPLRQRRHFRSGLCAVLLVLASTMASRAQPLLAPELQFTLSSSIAAVGQEWAIYADARIINPRFWNFMEPVVLSISSPLVSPTAYGPLWFGWGSHLVTANPHGNTPGVYDVVARASTADWVATLYPGWPGPGHPLDGVLDPADRMETTITRQVTIVSITNLTASAYHVAIGDTVTNTVTMTPVNAFDLVYWDWLGGGWYSGTGETYTRVMTDPGPWGPAVNGVLAITATCGNVTLTNLITVYQITGLSAAGNLVVVGDPQNPLSFTATIDPPGGTPPPVEWFLNGVSQGTAVTGATFTPASPPPGYYTVSAKMGSSEIYTGATVVGIASIELEPPTTSEWIPWPTPAYVPMGDSFRVIAIRSPPGDTWPTGYPVWSGAATGVGSIGNASFPSVSPSIAGVFSVIATCGNTVTKNAIVVSLTPHAVPVDNFAGRDTNVFGISELVDLSVAISPAGLTATDIGEIYWETDTIDGRLDKGSSGSADGTDRLSGPPLPMSVICGAMHRSSTYRNSVPIAVSPLTMPFIAPSDIVFHKLPIPSQGPDAGLWHIPNKFTIGFRAEVEVVPSYVSWDRVTMKEIDGQRAEVTNWFSLFTGEELMHRNSGAECKLLRGADVGSVFNVILDRPDWILLASQRVPNNIGSYTWRQIPWAWRGKKPDGTWDSYDEARSIKVDQTFTSDLQQTAGAKKKDEGFFYRAWNSPNTLGAALPDFIQNQLPPGW